MLFRWVQELFRQRFVRSFYTLGASLSVIITGWSTFDMSRDRADFSRDLGKNETFDFIVIGSGSAGAVVANRLSEHYSVLLLEAGGDPNPLTQIPSFAPFLHSYPEHDWMHKTVPQRKACLAFVNRESGWPQGKSLGGTSNLNYLVHSRGNPKDFDHWAEVTGDSRWNYQGVLPYFKKSEDFIGQWRNSKFHGHGGPVTVQVPPYIGSGKVFVEAAGEMGYPHVDLNGNFTEGFDLAYYQIKNGLRQGSYNAYIQPAKGRKNFAIKKYAVVQKILLQPGTNRAYGVLYERHTQTRHAFARKEIILSAGAILSPKILMLSGIGPKELLEDEEIEVLADLPGVGQNLQDHLSVYLGPFFADPGKTFLLPRDLSPQGVQDWWTRGTGFMTSSSIHATGFTCSSLAKAAGESKWPDIQYFFSGLATAPKWDSYFSHAYNLREDVVKEYYRHAVNQDTFTIAVSNGRPKQRGEITLLGDNVHLPPQIDPKYLQNPHDVQVMIEGIRTALKIVEDSKAFRNINARFTTQVFPGCEAVKFRSDEYWECFIRQFGISLHHIVGTCSMGPADSEMSVVDTELRVRKVKGLRVIDASVMPTPPVGNTHAPTVMIGEYGADMIHAYWKGKEMRRG